MAKPIIPITITETARSRIAIVLGIFCWCCILVGIVLVVIGTYIKLAIGPFTNLIENYNDTVLPIVLIVVGLATCILNALGGFASFFAQDLDKRECLRHFLLAYGILSALLTILIITGGLMCFSHIQQLHQSFKGGLTNAMKKYSENPTFKKEIDNLQMRYTCCGNEDYTDWFQIPWYKTGGEEPKNADAVPFSCCNPNIQRPCIHTKVHDNAAHVGYDYKTQVTVYTKGCKTGLMEFFGDRVLKNCGLAIILLFLIQVVLTVLNRYLHSSIVTANATGRLTATTEGYLFSLPIEESVKPGPPPAKEELASLMGGGSFSSGYERVGSRTSENIYENLQPPGTGRMASPKRLGPPPPPPPPPPPF